MSQSAHRFHLLQNGSSFPSATAVSAGFQQLHLPLRGFRGVSANAARRRPRRRPRSSRCRRRRRQVAPAPPATGQRPRLGRRHSGNCPGALGGVRPHRVFLFLHRESLTLGERHTRPRLERRPWERPHCPPRSYQRLVLPGWEAESHRPRLLPSAGFFHLPG